MKKLFSFVLMFCVLISICSCNVGEKEVVPSCFVDILDVGKADCIVIGTGTKIVMIDTGEVENLPIIISYLTEKEISKIDTLILTHFDKDHIGGASKIISDYNVTNVIESNFSSNSEFYVSYHDTLSALGIEPLKLSENYSFGYDGCKFTIDVPKKTKYKQKECNNSSLMISFECGEKRLLFCGDAMELRLSEFIDTSPQKYDFVKLPYHGNYLENYREFLDKILPTYGAITCSKKNPASPDTLKLLDEYGIEVFQTRYGTISFSIEENEISFK